MITWRNSNIRKDLTYTLGYNLQERKTTKTTKPTDNHQQKWLALTIAFQNEIQATLLRRHETSCLQPKNFIYYYLLQVLLMLSARGGHFMTTTRHETNFIKTGYPTIFKLIHGIVVKWKDTCLKTEGIFVITAHGRRFCWIEHSNVYSIVVYTAPVMLNDLIILKTKDLLYSGKERKRVSFKCQVV